MRGNHTPLPRKGTAIKIARYVFHPPLKTWVALHNPEGLR